MFHFLSKFRKIILPSFYAVLIFLVSLQAQTWTNNGPFGGYIIATAVDPVDTNFVYAGTYGAGIYRSSDGGLNWAAINSGMPVRQYSTIGSPTEPSWWFGDYFPVTTVKISPDNPGHLYAGTHGSGIVQSFNHGDTWTLATIGLPDSAIIRVLWIHPLDPAFLLCGTDYPSGGLFRSADGGSSWTLLSDVPNGATYHITTIANHPIHPDTIYAGFSSAGEPGLSWGLLRSFDRGISWEIVSQDFSFYDLWIDPNDTQNLWSVAYTGFLEWMLFYSMDAGSTWNPYPKMEDPWTDILTLYADNNGTLYVFDVENNLLRKSTDHGHTWSSFPISLPTSPTAILPGSGPNMAANPLNPETVYFGTGMAVYRSDDGGESYTIKENGMINTYINDVAVNPQNPQILYAGGEQGLWKTIDGGNSWIRLSTSTVNVIAIDPQNPDTLYWGGEDLMRSFDGGNTWEVLRQNTIITEIKIHPDSANKLSIGVYPSTIYMSNSWGSNWILSFSPPHGSFWIEDIAIHEQLAQIMYFGTGRNLLNHGLYKSVDGGLSWIKISDPGQITSLALHPVSPETVFAVTYKNLQVSYDGGESFIKIGQFIPSNNMSKIVIDNNNPSHLFAGTKDKGIFYSIDSGQSWASLAGNYDTRITDIDPVAALQRIYSGSHGFGVWRGENIILAIEPFNDDPSVVQQIQLLPTYPNPFNSQTVIPFYLPEVEMVELTIHNISGQLMRKLLNKALPAGYHEVRWNGIDDQNRAIASGIYLVRLHSAGQSSIRKVVFLK